MFKEQEFAEVVKCRNSPEYFLNTYGYVSGFLGKIPFRLFKYQSITLSLFLKYPFNIILKSRQLGISWLVAGYALWLCLFFSYRNVLMISIKDETAKELLRKVRYLYDNLPDFLKAELVTSNKSKMEFWNGSVIKSVPTSEEAGRSEALSLLIIDEAAYVRWIDKIWAAAYPTLSTGGAAILLSTPNGLGNFYADQWAKALEGKSLFNPIRLHYWYRPDYTPAWFERQRANMYPFQLAQEILGDFIGSGNLVCDVTALRALQDLCSSLTPVEILYQEASGEDNCGLYIFDRPEANKGYIMGIDFAEGGRGDFQALQVIEAQSGLQVAEYRSALPLRQFNDKIFEIGEMYNYALAAPEVVGAGSPIIMYLQDRNYPTIYEHRDLANREKIIRLGFPTNSQTRPILIDEIETEVREGVSGIRGIRTVNELMTFAWSKKGKAEAQPGKKDDLIMAKGITSYVRKMGQVSYDMPMIIY